MKNLEVQFKTFVRLALIEISEKSMLIHTIFREFWKGIYSLSVFFPVSRHFPSSHRFQSDLAVNSHHLTSQSSRFIYCEIARNKYFGSIRAVFRNTRQIHYDVENETYKNETKWNLCSRHRRFLMLIYLSQERLHRNKYSPVVFCCNKK